MQLGTPGEYCSCHNLSRGHSKGYEGRVCRDGWKGRPIVALGCKDGAPLSMHPLLCAVSRPVRHARLAAALLRALVLMRHAPLLVPLQQTGHGAAPPGAFRSAHKRLRCARQ